MARPQGGGLLQEAQEGAEGPGPRHRVQDGRRGGRSQDREGPRLQDEERHQRRGAPLLRPQGDGSPTGGPGGRRPRRGRDGGLPVQCPRGPDHPEPHLPQRHRRDHKRRGLDNPGGQRHRGR